MPKLKTASSRLRIKVVSSVKEACGLKGEFHAYLEMEGEKGTVYIEKSDYKTRARYLLHELMHVAVYELRQVGAPVVSEEHYACAIERLFEVLWRQGWRPTV